MPEMSRSALGSGRDGPAPRLIRAVGISSRMCWNAHRLNGGSCQLAERDLPLRGKRRRSGHQLVIIIRRATGLAISII